MGRTGTNPGLAPLSLVRDAATNHTVPSPGRTAPSPPASQTLQWVARAVRGDLGAWSRLYHDHFDAVFSHVCYLTGDPVLAEDLVQDVFARAMSNIHSFDQRAPFLAWVRGIALNVVRMHWRRAGTTARVHEDLQRLALLHPEDPSGPDRAHLQQQRMRMLYEVLATLPPTLREAFVLRELEEIPAPHAAAQLGITVGNLAVRLTRARARIRKALRQRGWLPGGEA